MPLYPWKLKAPLKDYIWGGTRLRDEYGKETGLEKIAESWELSAHKDGQSVVENGSLRGLSLEAAIEKEGWHRILGAHGSRASNFPLLIKLIDAHDNLSVQVHPDDAYAFKHEGEYGKTEMWYIIDADEDAELIYGFSREITREECRKRIEDNTLLEVVNHVKVRPGDVAFIPAGTLHAIGKGILLAEVQQSSNSTYRVYDYGRVGKDGKPRPLHIAKALDVLRFEPPAQPVTKGRPLECFAEVEVTELARCDLFEAFTIDLHGRAHMNAGPKGFQSLLMLTGSMELSWGGGEAYVEKGDSYFLPAGFGDYYVRGEGRFLLSRV